MKFKSYISEETLAESKRYKVYFNPKTKEHVLVTEGAEFDESGWELIVDIGCGNFNTPKSLKRIK